MTDQKPQDSKAKALLAYALDIEDPGVIDRARLDALIDEVCEDKIERASLVSLLATTQSPQLPSVLTELLGARLDRLKDALETAEDMDTVYGTWGQRTAGGTLLAGIGFTVTGVLSGGWAALAIAAGVLAGGATSYGRDRLKRRARTARRAVEQTERLLAIVARNHPPPG